MNENRAHLARPEVSLATHVEDVANVLKYEDLSGVVLVGNSSGGMVITGVADRSRSGSGGWCTSMHSCPRTANACWTSFRPIGGRQWRRWSRRRGQDGCSRASPRLRGTSSCPRPGGSLFRSAELRGIHPLGKLPAAIIDGKPLFESAAIVTAIADLVPEKGLIAAPGTWSRNLQYQWVCFALTEMEPYLHSTEINSIEFVLPKSQHVPAIIEQNAMMYKRAAAVLDAVLSKVDYLINDRFLATDIIVAYTTNWGHEFRMLSEFPNLLAYLERLFARKHCTLTRF